MTDRTADNVSSRSWVKSAVVALSLLLCIFVIIFLATKIRREVDALAVASADNLHWSLSQVEVELLQLEAALLRVDSPNPDDLREVRKRFDVFYNRISILRQSPLFESLRAEPEFEKTLTKTTVFLDRTVPAIDASDDLLFAELPMIEREAKRLSPALRTMSLQGIAQFAATSDHQRETVAQTLRMIAGLTIALALALFALATMLLAQFRNLRAQTRKNQMTSTRLEAIINSSLDGVMVVDRSGSVVDFNAAAEKIFGYSKSEAVGAQMDALIIPDDKREAHLKGMGRYLKTGENSIVGKGRLQMEARRKNGHRFPVELSVSSTLGEDGENFVAFLRDISDRIRAENALLRARDEALTGEKAKAELLAVMSHEMRTPLNGMLGTLELLQDTKLSPRQSEYLGIIDTSGKMLLHHVNEVLEISRLDSGKAKLDAKPFDLSALLAEICDSQRPVAAANGNQLTVSGGNLQGELVSGDALRLRQILLNILGNALKFTRNGSVRVEMDRLDQGDVVEFRISDTGIGIAEKDMTRIFEDFVTVDSSYGRASTGTGLGLGITKRLVEVMGGTIGVKSTSEPGSLFWTRLPLPQVQVSETMASGPEPEDADAKRLADDETTRPPLDVLVVEDNQINRVVVREMLEKEGHNVWVTDDGEQGVEMAASQVFDVILMDVSMPRMDGVQATRAIRNGSGASAGQPILALTAHALPDEIDRFRQAGMNDALVKPVSRARLRSALGKIGSDLSAPPPGPEVSDTLNVSVLSEMKQVLGQQKFGLMLEQFRGEVNEILTRLSDSETLPASDPEFVELVHKLAGSACMFGAQGLHQALSRIEAAVKSGAVEEAITLRGGLADTWNRTQTQLSGVETE